MSALPKKKDSNIVYQTPPTASEMPELDVNEFRRTQNLKRRTLLNAMDEEKNTKLGG